MKANSASGKNSGKNKEVYSAGKNKVTLSNLGKIFWPEEKYTKGDLLTYYKTVAKVIMPYLLHRPMSMHRHPNGISESGFFQKDVEPKQLPDWAKSVQIYSESNDKMVDYLVCENEATLLYMVNLGCIEINPWNSTVRHSDKPDYLIIDLDPGDKNTFADVVQVALEVKKVFDALETDCYCKTSGATGLHIYVPLHAKYKYAEVRDAAGKIAHAVHARIPKLSSVERDPAKRKDLVYVDFLQNSRGQTLASAYSVRPRMGATVSAPLDWKEVNKKLSPARFTMRNMPARIDKLGDLWKPVLGKGISLEKTLKKLENL